MAKLTNIYKVRYFLNSNARRLLKLSKHKIMKTIVILTFFGLMSYQLFEVIESYYKYELKIKTEVLKQFYLPNIIIRNKLEESRIDSLIKIYPEIRDKIDEVVKKVPLNDQIDAIDYIYRFYWRLILDKHKYKQLFDLLKPEEIIKSCSIWIKRESYDCGKIHFRYSSKVNLRVKDMTSILVHLNQSYKEFLMEKDVEQNLEKVSIELMKSNFTSVELETNFKKESIEKDEYEMVDTNNKDISFYYSGYSLQRLSNSKFRCKKTNAKTQIFCDKDKSCYYDCIAFLSNQTYGCIGANKGGLNIDINIEKDLLILGYKVCPLNISTVKTIDKKIKMDCEDKCLPDCNEVYFKREIILSKNSGENNLTKKINLFPMNTPHIKYVETLKLDLNQLIYTVGGIIGFWFGLSPKIPDLILYSTNLFKLLIIIS